MKKIIVLAIILCVGCVDQGGLLQKEEATEVFEDSAEIISLDCETFNGFIELYTWDSTTYKVEVNKWARASTSARAKEIVEKMQVNFSDTAGVLTVKAEHVRNAGADIAVYIPETALDTVELSTTNGYIQTEDITASSISLETTNGYIEASATADDITVTTTNGKIQGFFQGETVNIETTNGKVDIECGDNGIYTIRTTNGRIDMKVGLQGEFDISTSNADIDITVKGDFAFDLETTNGVITVKDGEIHYVQDSRTHKKGYTTPETDLSITASTTNGDVTVATQ